MNELTYKKKENNSYMNAKQRQQNDFNLSRVLDCANFDMLNNVVKFPRVNEWENERIWQHMVKGDEREKLWKYSETTRLEFEHWKRINSGSPLGIKQATALAKERQFIKTNNFKAAIHYLKQLYNPDLKSSKELYFYSAVYSAPNARPFAINNNGTRRNVFVNQYGQNVFQPLVDALQGNGNKLTRQANKGVKNSLFGKLCTLYGDIYSIEYDVQADGTINPHAHVLFVTDSKLNVRKFQRNIQRELKGSLKLKFHVKQLQVMQKESNRRPKKVRPAVIDLSKSLESQKPEMNAAIKFIEYINKQTLLPMLDKKVKSKNGRKIKQYQVIDSLDYFTQLDMYASVINTLYTKKITRFGSHGVLNAKGITKLRGTYEAELDGVKVSTNQNEQLNNVIPFPVNDSCIPDLDFLNFNFVKGIPPP